MEGVVADFITARKDEYKGKSNLVREDCLQGSWRIKARIFLLLAKQK